MVPNPWTILLSTSERFALISCYTWVLFRILLHWQFFISILHPFIDTEKHIFFRVFPQTLKHTNLRSLCLSFLDPQKVPLKYSLFICSFFLSFSVKLLIRFSIFCPTFGCHPTYKPADPNF